MRTTYWQIQEAVKVITGSPAFQSFLSTNFPDTPLNVYIGEDTSQMPGELQSPFLIVQPGLRPYDVGSFPEQRTLAIDVDWGFFMTAVDVAESTTTYNGLPILDEMGMLIVYALYQGFSPAVFRHGGYVLSPVHPLYEGGITCSLSYELGVNDDNDPPYYLPSSSTSSTSSQDSYLTSASSESSTSSGGAPSGAFALQYSGSNYVDITGTAFSEILNPQGPFTISFWQKTTDAGQAIMGNAPNNVSQGFIIFIDGSGGRMCCIAFFVGSGAAFLEATSNVKDGNWHLSTITYDGSTLSIYTDGSLENTVSVTSDVINPSSVDWTFGTLAGSNDFVGTLDEVAMWSRAISSGEVSTIYNGGTGYLINTSSGPGASGLTALWHFNEGTGTTAHDSSGNGFDGTLQGSTPPAWVPGIV